MDARTDPTGEVLLTASQLACRFSVSRNWVYVRQLGHASIRQTEVYAHLGRRGRGQAAADTESAIWSLDGA